MTPAEVEAIAQGRVWSGTRGRTNGLVDELGGLWRSLEIAKQAAGIPASRAVTLAEAPDRGFIDVAALKPRLLGVDSEAVEGAALAASDVAAGSPFTVAEKEYLEALARSDAAALRRMHITRAEYAYLYFPTSKMMRAPYELAPDIAWLLLSAESAKGLTSVLHRVGGKRLELRRVRCPGEPLREGRNTVWRDCVVRYRGEGNAERERPLFAAILERGGRFKFFSYATPL